jgi:hypothetical protein
MSFRKSAGEHVLHCNTFSVKNKFKALKTLLNSAEYHNKEKSIFVSMLKNLAGTQQQVDSMQPSRAKLSSARSS